MKREARSGGRVDITELLVPPHKHELKTAHFFSDLGYEVKFIRPSNIPENHRGDFTINGTEWEVKSPLGKGSRTIIKLYGMAVKQSENIIFDLRRTPLPDQTCIHQLEKAFHDKRSKRLMIITKAGELMEYPKNCLDK